MARLVNPSPPLPYAGSSISVSELARFDADLVRMLTFYLRDLAERANASVPLDGSEVMTGDLNLGGNDITNVQTITMPNLILNGFAANAQIELGRQDGVASTPVIDFHSGATAIDFDSRILATGGTGVTGGGNLTIDAANLILPRGRLQFPSTPNPSTDATTIDEYREGTWTPDLRFGGVNTGITYSYRQASYIKIGRRVMASARFILSSKGAAAGGASISGLPFVVSNSPAATLFSFKINYWTSMALACIPGGYCVQNTSTASLINGANNTTVTTLDNTFFTNTTDFIFTIHYFADS